MAAVYPGAVKSFGSPVADAVDTVYAAHINDLRDEVVAVETELGTGLKSSTWTGAWANTASWSNLAQRLTNIERGIVTTSDVHTQYLKKAGDAMTGALDMGSQKITTLQAGASTNDAVNYGQVILRSGVNAMSANLNMGTTYKITNLANGSVSTDALAYGQVLASATTLISGLFSGTNPVMNGTAAVGTSAQPAHSDHVHPSDTSRVAKAGDTMTGALTLSGDPTADLHAATKKYVDTGGYPQYAEGLRTSSTGSLSSVIGYQIVYQSETDPGGILNAGTGVFTLPAGLWLLTAHAAVTFGSSSSALNLSFIVGGSSSNFTRVANPGTGSYAGLSVSEVVQVSSSQTVAVTLAVGGLGIDWYVNTAKVTAVKIGNL